MRGHQCLVPGEGAWAPGLSSPQFRPNSISPVPCMSSAPPQDPPYSHNGKAIDSKFPFSVSLFKIQVTRPDTSAFTQSAVCRFCVAAVLSVSLALSREKSSGGIFKMRRRAKSYQLFPNAAPGRSCVQWIKESVGEIQAPPSHWSKLLEYFILLKCSSLMIFACRI